MRQTTEILVGILIGIAAVAGIALVLLGFTRTNAIGNCERSNIGRRELRGFILDAERARRQTGDLAIAERYERRRRAIPDVDCRKAIPLIP